MRNRHPDEIKKDLEDCREEMRHLYDCAQVHKGHGHWTYGNPSVFREMNEVRSRIRNLHLELNRVRQRSWGNNG